MVTFGQIRRMIANALAPMRQRLHNLVARVNLLLQRFEDAVARIGVVEGAVARIRPVERELDLLRREFDEFKDDIEIGRMGRGVSDESEGDPFHDDILNRSNDRVPSERRRLEVSEDPSVQNGYACRTQDTGTSAKMEDPCNIGAHSLQAPRIQY